MTEKVKLLDQVRQVIRVKNYSYRTEQAYVTWIKRYILYHDKRHPAEMGEPEVEAFLTHLAIDRSVAAYTQNQALNALLLLYRGVLRKPLQHTITTVRAKKTRRLPTVLARNEVEMILAEPEGESLLMAQLLWLLPPFPGSALVSCYPDPVHRWLVFPIFPHDRHWTSWTKLLNKG